MEDIIDQVFDKLFDDYAEILDKPYRFCSVCRRFKPMVTLGCWDIDIYVPNAGMKYIIGINMARDNI